MIPEPFFLPHSGIKHFPLSLYGAGLFQDQYVYSFTRNHFRYFYFFAVFVRWAKSGTGIRNEESSDQLNMEGRNTEYWETLERLLDSKMQADYEETLQDDFADLGKDIMNFISANNIQNNAKLYARLAEIEQAISQRKDKGD